MDVEKQPLLESHPSNEQEPTLRELQDNVRKAQRAYFKAWSKSTSGKWHKRIMLSVTAFLTLFMVFCMGVIVSDSLTDDEGDGWRLPSKVALEAHIMSKCPDARDCLHDMILPAMQNVSDKVNFKLSYIGTATDDDDGVLCKHGPQECLGNMIELCAAHLYPDPKIHLGFTMCLTRQYEEIPDRSLIEDCALEHSIPVSELDACLDQDDGVFSKDLLRASFERSADAAVTKSCTVRLGGRIRCIRDDGEWKDCEQGSSAADLVADVLRLTSDRWDDWE